ncbi:ABC transporter ATP-binding protein [Rhabdothermincola sp. EGI L10124]|nr:ABC transporter ATP-binding protein [Rhabdothermincola salaria]MCD9624700.1 ABC transporter ATP-binding protein [Rhabdothermincola salaria]
MSAGQPLLAVNGLSTRFATDRGELLAVDGVSFELDRGETLGIVGESGSGKSVLVRSIMNILPKAASVDPASEVLLDGRDVRGLTLAEARHFFGVEVAMVFQDPMTSLNPVKKVGQQLTEPLRYHLGLNRTDARSRAVELLGHVGIPHPERRLSQYPHELSGGMRQRVTIAIALSCEPKLLIADEPTTALDVTVQKQILDLLQSLQEETGMGMILITHDLGVVAGRADRIGVMYAARLSEMAPTRELFINPRHPYTTALMRSIPRVELPSHSTLEAIPGRPPDMVSPPPACRFAPRCPQAQPTCGEVDPGYVVLDGPAHQWCCHFPTGTPEGDEALRRNTEAGVTAAGLDLRAEVVS